LTESHGIVGGDILLLKNVYCILRLTVAIGTHCNDDCDVGWRKQQKPAYRTFACEFPVSWFKKTSDIV